MGKPFGSRESPAKPRDAAQNLENSIVQKLLVKICTEKRSMQIGRVNVQFFSNTETQRRSQLGKVLRPRGLMIQVSKSLILAQDERWRRA
jgi:hypothetical protein